MGRKFDEDAARLAACARSRHSRPREYFVEGARWQYAHYEGDALAAAEAKGRREALEDMERALVLGLRSDLILQNVRTSLAALAEKGRVADGM
jgi:hypothetical protein